MCDEKHFEADLKRYSRREVGVLAAGVGAAMLLPTVANGAEVAGKEVTIKTPDGECDAYFVAPKDGKHPAVLVWPDIFGLRPAFRGMADRLAQSGYSVLVINQFYRSKKAPIAPDGTNTPIGDVRPLAQKLNPVTHVTDAQAFIGWLDQQAEVDTGKKIGTIGYCMGGAIVFRTAAAIPERVGAGCSFHGGGLATNDENSPHLLIPKMKAKFLVAIAENDDERDPEAKETLKKAFADNHVEAEIEVYPAGHGWCPTDTKVYNQEQAERAWKRMLDLFSKALV